MSVWGSTWFERNPSPVIPSEQSFTTKLYRPGKYVVKWDGSGTLIYSFDAVKVVGESAPGRDVINVATPSDGGILIILTATTQGNHLRNLRVCHIDDEALLDAGELFEPQFLTAMAPFKSLRFLMWQTINYSTLTNWADRPLPSNLFWGYRPKGVPMEIICELGNKLNKDIWVCVPTYATDDYIEQMAALFLANLNSNLTVRIEYGNEVWGGVPIGNVYAKDQGNALWPGQGTEHERVLNWYAKRSCEMSQIWRSVWGDQAHRLKTVFGTQAGNPGGSTVMLNCSLWTGQCYTECDELAMAAYAGGSGCPTSWPNEPDGGLNKIFNRFFQGDAESPPASPANGFLKETYDWIVAQKAVADSFGIPLTFYEFGQHLRLNGENSPFPVNTMYNNANRDPRMGHVTALLMKFCRDLGVSLPHYFDSCSKYNFSGSWGAKESSLQVTTPKLSALHDHCALRSTGVNVGEFEYYEPEDAILNMVHINQRWIPDDGVAWDLGEAQNAYIQADSDGYPTTMTPLPGGSFTRLKLLVQRSRKPVDV